MRKSVGLDKIVDFAAVLGVAVEKRGDAIRAVQDVAAEGWAWYGSGHVVHRRPMITRPLPQPHGRNCFEKIRLENFFKEKV
jgi:hypothetical protein